MTREELESLELHPLCRLFPVMEAPELRALAQDIEACGMREPILIHPESNQVVDGQNRLFACLEYGLHHLVEVQYWDGDNLVELVASRNLHRRHLTTSQRAMLTARLLEESANWRTVEEAAAEAGVPKRSLERAQKVSREAPEFAEAVASGRVPLGAAEDCSGLSRDEQLAAIQEGPEGVKRKAKEEREKKRKASPGPRGWDQITDLFEAIGKGKEQEAQLKARLGEMLHLRTELDVVRGELQDARRDLRVTEQELGAAKAEIERLRGGAS